MSEGGHSAFALSGPQDSSFQIVMFAIFIRKTIANCANKHCGLGCPMVVISCPKPHCLGLYMHQYPGSCIHKHANMCRFCMWCSGALLNQICYSDCGPWCPSTWAQWVLCMHLSQGQISGQLHLMAGHFAPAQRWPQFWLRRFTVDQDLQIAACLRIQPLSVNSGVIICVLRVPLPVCPYVAFPPGLCSQHFTVGS